MIELIATIGVAAVLLILGVALLGVLAVRYISKLDRGTRGSK